MTLALKIQNPQAYWVTCFIVAGDLRLNSDSSSSQNYNILLQDTLHCWTSELGSVVD